MTEKKMVSAKIASRTAQRLDHYAENEGISRSQAIDRMVKQGLDVEESDMRLVPLRADGGTELEDQLSEMTSDLEKMKESSEGTDLVMGTLILSVIWIGFELAIGFPPIATILTGSALILLLAHLFFSIEGVLNYV